MPVLTETWLVPPGCFEPNGWSETLAEVISDQLPPGGTLLDVGCGVGAIALLVAEKRPGSHVVGVDCNETAIIAAQENARRRFALGTEFYRGDLYDALPNRLSADVIVITVPWEPESMYPEDTNPREAYVDNTMVMARALAGASEHLAPGGTVIVSAQKGMDHIFGMVGLRVIGRWGDDDGNAIYALSQ